MLVMRRRVGREGGIDNNCGFFGLRFGICCIYWRAVKVVRVAISGFWIDTWYACAYFSHR